MKILTKGIIFLLILAVIGIVAREVRYYQLVEQFKDEYRIQEIKETNDKPIKKEAPKQIRKETPREYVPEKYIKWKDNTQDQILEELKKLNENGGKRK